MADRHRSGGPREALFGALLVLAAAALWATLGLFGKLLFAEGLAPSQVASGRAWVAFVVLGAVALVRTDIARVRRAELPALAAYGIVAIALFYWVYLAAIARTTVAVAAALLYTAPAFVLLLSWSLRWEPVRPARLVPLTMTVAGAFLVTGAVGALAGGARLSTAAVLFGLASGLTYALFTVVGKRLRARLSSATIVLYAYLFGSLTLSFVAPPWTLLEATPRALLLIVIMGLVATLVPALLFLVGVRAIEASTASMLATMEPVVATALSVAILGEPATPAALAGILLIVLAAGWISRTVVPPAV